VDGVCFRETVHDLEVVLRVGRGRRRFLPPHHQPARCQHRRGSRSGGERGLRRRQGALWLARGSGADRRGTTSALTKLGCTRRGSSELAAALPHITPGVYAGFLGNEGEARVREAYPGPTWDRLVAIKSRYDPQNLFRLNQNIPPRPAAVGD
jgi:hypothetical protein